MHSPSLHVYNLHVYIVIPSHLSPVEDSSHDCWITAASNSVWMNSFPPPLQSIVRWYTGGGGGDFICGILDSCVVIPSQLVDFPASVYILMINLSWSEVVSLVGLVHWVLVWPHFLVRQGVLLIVQGCSASWLRDFRLLATHKWSLKYRVRMCMTHYVTVRVLYVRGTCKRIHTRTAKWNLSWKNAVNKMSSFCTPGGVLSYISEGEVRMRPNLYT